MLEDRDLVIFGGDWGRFPSVLERIADHLLPTNRILWVGSLSMRRPRIRIYDVHRIAGRIRDLFFADGQRKRDLHPTDEIHPFIFPFYDIPGVRSTNDVMLRSILRTRMSHLGFRDVIILTATPMVAEVIGTLKESSSHYICLDDYSEYDGAYRCIRQLEESILEKVDSSFALSDPLMQTRKAKSGENHFLPMGVDTDLFSPSEEPFASELGFLKKPIVGFFGQIGSYVDIDLIVRCAKAYPQVSFVVIGRAYVDLSIFEQASNIVFLGEVPYRELPRYARAFDVGLNPRVLSQLSLAMNPLKILEYLSLGMAVVSTDLPAVRRFKNFVNIAESREHFVELIAEALRDASQERRDARRKIAQQYSWRSIAERLSETIDRIDAAKHRYRPSEKFDNGSPS